MEKINNSNEPIRFSVLHGVELFELVSVKLDTNTDKWHLSWSYLYDESFYFDQVTGLNIVKKIFDEVYRRGNRVEVVVSSESDLIVFNFVIK